MAGPSLFHGLQREYFLSESASLLQRPAINGFAVRRQDLNLVGSMRASVFPDDRFFRSDFENLDGLL
jgi:hypothetical protein